jgi:hypothetical protein
MLCSAVFGKLCWLKSSSVRVSGRKSIQDAPKQSMEGRPTIIIASPPFNFRKGGLHPGAGKGTGHRNWHAREVNVPGQALSPSVLGHGKWCNQTGIVDVPTNVSTRPGAPSRGQTIRRCDRCQSGSSGHQKPYCALDDGCATGRWPGGPSGAGGIYFGSSHHAIA